MPCGRPLAIIEEVSASAVQVVRAVLWFQVDVRFTWNLEQYLHSTKACRLELENLPEDVRKAHTLPGLSHSSLIYIGKLCDAGCEASFNQHNMAITKYKQVLLQGTRDIMTGLWRFSL